jgi:cellulose synthase/poly-beta-1,6-N-acetylglucosamine synthase-like glycosyltransferase
LFIVIACSIGDFAPLFELFTTGRFEPAPPNLLQWPIAAISPRARIPCPVRLSVIVPAYNCADYLERCLHSLLAQEVQPMEIIVCDDGSTDGTVDIIKEAVSRRHTSTNRAREI